MHTGMLWFDNSSIPLADKVRKAADYYVKKYGRQPDLGLAHPSMMGGLRQIDVDKITVRAYRPVLPGHIWIGIEDKNG